MATKAQQLELIHLDPSFNYAYSPDGSSAQRFVFDGASFGSRKDAYIYSLERAFQFMVQAQAADELALAEAVGVLA